MYHSLDEFYLNSELVYSSFRVKCVMLCEFTVNSPDKPQLRWFPKSVDVLKHSGKGNITQGLSHVSVYCRQSLSLIYIH